VKWRTSLRLALRAQRHYWFRYWLAASIVAAAVAAIHVNLALTVRPLDRAADLMESFETRYLFLFDSFATTLETADLDAQASALARAGIDARFDFLCGYFFTEHDPIPLLLCSLPTPRPREYAVLFRVVEGREPTGEGDEAMIEATLAGRWHVQVGSMLPLFKNKPPLKVVGIYARGVQIGSGDILSTLPAVQRLKNRRGELSFILLQVREGANVERAREQVAALFPERRVIPASAAAERLRAGTQALRLAELAQAVLIASLCGLIALFTLFSAVNERMADFQVLRVLGISGRSIFGQTLLEGLMLGAKGTISGVLVGELILVSIAPKLHPVLGGHSQWAEFVLPLAVGAGVAILGALLPALRAGGASPHELLH
jgi:hypothetical protein